MAESYAAMDDYLNTTHQAERVRHTEIPPPPSPHALRPPTTHTNTHPEVRVARTLRKYVCACLLCLRSRAFICFYPHTRMRTFELWVRHTETYDSA